MWKLPMFGCRESSQVLTEISNCEKTFPGHFIRLAAFDAVRQVCHIMIVNAINDSRCFRFKLLVSWCIDPRLTRI